MEKSFKNFTNKGLKSASFNLFAKYTDRDQSIMKSSLKEKNI